MRVQDLALQRDKYKHLSDDEWRWFLQQAEGRERTADKLPSFAATEGWWYPVRLSCEQCSSEVTARYKSLLVNGKFPNGECLDLTGGYGVDTIFLSEQFSHTCYVERDAELCRIAAHNFSLANKNISVYHSSAEEFLRSHHSINPSFHQYSLIFLDPARRDSHGGKVFRLEDCTPNVVELLPDLLARLAPDGLILLKLSPMIDLTQALKELAPSYTVHHTPYTLLWDIHIVAVKNEVKEVLLLMSRSTNISKDRISGSLITAIDLARPGQAFTFTREEERDASFLSFQGELEGAFLYEPNAAILKAGAYKSVALRFGLRKLDGNTHLYTSDTLYGDFPGRVWKIIRLLHDKTDIKTVNGMKANVLTRNHPLTPEQLKKKLHLCDGGSDFIIGCRVGGQPTIFLAGRIL